LIDTGDVIQDDRVIKRVLASALALVIAEKKCAVLFDRTTERKSKLVLPQLVQPGAASGLLASIPSLRKYS